MKATDFFSERLKEYGIDKSKFTKEQILEIELGICYGLSEEQIKVYAKPEFNSLQMFIIRLGFKSYLPMEEVKAYAKPELAHYKMREIRLELIKKHTL